MPKQIKCIFLLKNFLNERFWHKTSQCDIFRVANFDVLYIHKIIKHFINLKMFLYGKLYFRNFVIYII